MEFVRTNTASYTEVGNYIIEVSKGLIVMKDKIKLDVILTINTVAGMSALPVSSIERSKLLTELARHI